MQYCGAPSLSGGYLLMFMLHTFALGLFRSTAAITFQTFCYIIASMSKLISIIIAYVGIKIL